MSKAQVSRLREAYLRAICDQILGYRNEGSRVPTIADSSSEASIEIARGIIETLGFSVCSDPKTGQTAGALFTQLTMNFIRDVFGALAHLRPGDWLYSTAQAPGIAGYEQYEHLSELSRILKQFKELAASLGGDYLVVPDIIVARAALSDPEINAAKTLVDGSDVAGHTPLRAVNRTDPLPLLHASISCKWTIRSDRAQNTRTEALNLLRNRRGNAPHIVAVTFEPMPSRIASIAMGTGDIDCTYHAALPELLEAVKRLKNESQGEMLDTLVSARRLRDISDLPFDLAV